MSLYSLFFVWFKFLLRWLLLETEFWSECCKAWTLAAGLLQPEWSTACRRCRTLEVRWMMVVACCPSIHFPRLFFQRFWFKDGSIYIVTSSPWTSWILMDVGTTEDIQLAGVGGISGALPWAGCVLWGVRRLLRASKRAALETKSP